MTKAVKSGKWYLSFRYYVFQRDGSSSAIVNHLFFQGTDAEKKKMLELKISFHYSVKFFNRFFSKF